MVLTPSNMLELGTIAPDFNLPNTEGEMISPQSLEPFKGLLVVFMCNHCPYVKHVQHELASIGMEYGDRGIAMVGINANDSTAHPDDSYELMKQEVTTHKYTFHYLHDETQEVAKAYMAACTPDIFLFDHNKHLVYRGQLDDSRPGNDIELTGKDLRNALDSLLGGIEVPQVQKPSMGCNIKWKAGNEPDYFGGK